MQAPVKLVAVVVVMEEVDVAAPSDPWCSVPALDVARIAPFVDVPSPMIWVVVAPADVVDSTTSGVSNSEVEPAVVDDKGDGSDVELVDPAVPDGR